MNIPLKRSSYPISPEAMKILHEHSQLNMSPSYNTNNFEDNYQSSVIINDINVDEELEKIENDRKNFFKMLSMSFYGRAKSHSVELNDSRRSRKFSEDSQDENDEHNQSIVRAKSCYERKRRGKLLQQENINLVKKQNPLINDLEVRLDQFCPKILLPTLTKNTPDGPKPDKNKIKKALKGKQSDKDQLSRPPEPNKFASSITEFDSVPVEHNVVYTDMDAKKMSNSELYMYAEGLLELLHKSQKLEGTENYKSKNKAFDAMLQEMWGAKLGEATSSCADTVSKKANNKAKKDSSKGETKSFLYDKSSTTVTNEDRRSFQLSSDSQSRVYLKQGSQDKGLNHGGGSNRKASYGKQSSFKKSREQESRSGEREKSRKKSKEKEKKKVEQTNNSQGYDNENKKSSKRDSRVDSKNRVKTENRSPSQKSESKRSVPAPLMLSKRTPIYVDKDLESWDTMPISISQGEITRKAQIPRRNEIKRTSPESKGRKKSPQKVQRVKPAQGEKVNTSVRLVKGKSIEE